MWINPKYADQFEQPRPPAENGQRLATFPRADGAEMRVNLSEFQGKPFISLRLWERDQGGAWWPVKGKGCSVRVGEAAELAEALASVSPRSTDRVSPGRGDDIHSADVVPQGPPDCGGPSPRNEAPRFIDKGRPVRPPRDAGKLAGAEPGQGFDELEG